MTSGANQVAFDLTKRNTIGGTVTPAALSVSYVAATQSYTVALNSKANTFSTADARPNSLPGEKRFQTTTGTGSQLLTLVTTTYTGGRQNQYVGLGYLQRLTAANGRQDNDFASFTYGTASPAGDVPRTGTARYAIDIFGLYSQVGQEPRVFNGIGDFNADFGLGVFDARSTGTFSLTGLITNSVTFGGGIDLVATGRLASSNASFSGSAAFGGLTYEKIPGALTGSFYGTGASELGASFAGADALRSTLSGAFTGYRDGFPASGKTLVSLTGSNSFLGTDAVFQYGFNGFVGSIVGGGMIARDGRLDRTDGQSFTFTPGTTYEPSGSYSEADRIPASSANFDSYRKTLEGQDITIDLYRPGSANTELALTYLSFARWMSPQFNAQGVGVRPSTSIIYFAYGLETPVGIIAGRTGHASYSGIVYGKGFDGRTQTLYDISGTSSFAVDFSRQSLSGALNLLGTQTGTQATSDFGSFTLAGPLGGNISEARFGLVQGGIVAGELLARFYGPNGEEIGGAWNVSGPLGTSYEGLNMSGITVAKQ